MRPLDPRLVREVAAVRWHLAGSVAAGVLSTGLLLLQAALLAHTVARVGDGLDALAGGIAAVAVVALARAALSSAAETAALRSAAAVQSDLRRRLVAHAARGGSADAGATVTLALRGLDALEDYVARFLPQLVLAVLVPAAVLVVVAGADWVSALVIGLTLPLIPVFMALVGRHTQERTDRQWALLERLGGHFLDVVQGLPTLALFRRTRAAAGQIRRVTGEHRTATMGTLRVAFLSAFVLELLATLAVALVAVEVGLRLLYGRLDLETALLVLILAPEAYLPLREVGARFHASTEGVAAAARVFEVLDTPPVVPAGLQQSHLPATSLRESGFPATGVALHRVGLRYPGREEDVLREITLDLRPGRTLLVTGPSGAGKSSLLALLLRLADPTSGRITVDGRDLCELDPDAWRRLVAWVPQHPHLLDATVADNIRLGDPDADDAAVRRAAELAGVHDVIAALPAGYATRLGERGTSLSAGERRRVALARAFLRRAAGAPVVLLDEPTAHLDADTAGTVRAAAARLLDGALGVVVAHDDGWAALADDVLDLRPVRTAVPA
ncbi:MAG: thiol reductant ABC exporter subunit CydD [Pseudonocardiales bacterium]|nr:thiol reductant ABC exporter subunit CydD [Pseudonocardiales bacterium]